MYDNAGRLQSLNGNLGGAQRTYASGITYDAGSRMTREQLGTTTPIYNKLFYNSRGQLAEIREGLTANDTSFQRGAIIKFYDRCWGMCWNPNNQTGDSMPNNNGNLKVQQTSKNLNRGQACDFAIVMPAICDSYLAGASNFGGAAANQGVNENGKPKAYRHVLRQSRSR